ncbi:MAG: hypothetical protein V7646_153 [Pseudonocardia sp.]
MAYGVPERGTRLTRTRSIEDLLQCPVDGRRWCHALLSGRPASSPRQIRSTTVFRTRADGVPTEAPQRSKPPERRPPRQMCGRRRERGPATAGRDGTGEGGERCRMRTVRHCQPIVHFPPFPLAPGCPPTMPFRQVAIARSTFLCTGWRESVPTVESQQPSRPRICCDARNPVHLRIRHGRDVVPREAPGERRGDADFSGSAGPITAPAGPRRRRSARPTSRRRSAEPPSEPQPLADQTRELLDGGHRGHDLAWSGRSARLETAEIACANAPPIG